MKICFLVELPFGMWQWDDGLRGAMKILEKKYDVCYHLNGELGDHKPEILFAWGGSFAKTTKQAHEYNGKTLLLYAGGGISREAFEGIDMVCFENQLHTDEARALGIKCMTAFGTDTTIFKPMKQPIIFDTIYPGAFGLWKRKDLFAKAVKGLKALTLGNIQLHEPECLQVCVDNNIAVSADIPQSRLPYFMNMSSTVVVLPVPEIGGQRTVIEAMACNVPIIVPSDAPLVCEFAKHGGIIVEPNPSAIRQAVLETYTNDEGYQYVMENLTEVHYAKKLEIAIQNI